MKIFAISDLHLAISTDKPMDVFGGAWQNYLEKIKSDWKKKVAENDIVLIAGDISWAMKLEDFQKDLSFFDDLKGTIILTRGNHDYWWGSLSKMKEILPKNIHVLQNDAVLKIGNFIFCGTRGWEIASVNAQEEDKKIYNRELIRLELALSSALALKTDQDDKIVAMIHYPPYSPKNKKTEFVNLFNKYQTSCVVFGHVHNENSGLNLVEKIDNITYYLTSCDLLNNELIEIIP